MNRFNQLFAQSTQRAFIPFFTLGDPNPEDSFDMICTAVDAGADGIELGFPFSDPITDGPVNQRSMRRALNAGTTYRTCLDLLSRVRAKYPALPIGLLLYYNLLYMRGADAYRELADIGIDAIVCSDLPYEESADHMAELSRHGLGCIQMVAPNTPLARAKLLFSTSSAFTYVISRFGTTGTSEQFERSATERIALLSQSTDAPIVVGFGISKVEQVHDFWRSGAHGVIVGSLFSMCIEKHLQDLAAARIIVREFIADVQSGKDDGPLVPPGRRQHA